MRGVPRDQLKVSIPVQQDQDRQDGRTEVITENTMASGSEALQAKITFSQDKMYFLSPFKLAIVESLPSSIFGEEDQGHYKYSLATTVEGNRSKKGESNH